MFSGCRNSAAFRRQAGIGNSLFWALCTCIHQLCCCEVRFDIAAMPSWKIQREQGGMISPQAPNPEGSAEGQEGRELSTLPHQAWSDCCEHQSYPKQSTFNLFF